MYYLKYYSSRVGSLFVYHCTHTPIQIYECMLSAHFSMFSSFNKIYTKHHGTWIESQNLGGTATRRIKSWRPGWVPNM